MSLGKTTGRLLLEACPNLKSLDIGFSDSKVHPTLDVLYEAFKCAPKLESLAIDMWALSAGMLHVAVTNLGPQLKQLCVRNETITGNYVSDFSLRTLARSCPNLVSLSVKNSYSRYYSQAAERKTDEGFKALINGCALLEHIEMGGQSLTSASLKVLVQRLSDQKLKNLQKLIISGLGENSALGDGADEDTAAIKKHITEMLGNDNVAFTS